MSAASGAPGGADGAASVGTEDSHDDDLLLGRDTGLGQSPSTTNLVELQAQSTLLRRLSSQMSASSAMSETAQAHAPALFELSSHIVAQGVSAVVDDSFSRCFESAEPVAWNWNVYLFPCWLVGVGIRYLVAFPLRLAALLAALILGILFLGVVKGLSCLCSARTRRSWEAWTAQVICSAFVMSWSGVIRFHGTRPQVRGGKPPGVYVANHSSMIDFIVLQQSHSYAVLGQKHPGWVGLAQDYLLGGLEPIWFQRGESSNRRLVSDKLKEHAENASKLPLLVFPEGTCVNNEYVVEFKKRVFELGVPINPVAIKYNKIFVDAYWNSRAQGFSAYLFQLMTSWAVVCDVWYMDPMTAAPGESAVAFAKRVQVAIARRAGLKPVDWDGYMKYWRPSERFFAARRQQVSAALLKAHGMAPEEWGVAAPAPAAEEEVPDLAHVPRGDLDAAAEALQKHTELAGEESGLRARH